jgi:8-oxo-dGTP pyrophosphatase MutT (NUDIX family)
LLLYPLAERWHVPLTLRGSHLPDHGGQVCLPGGALEPGETGSEAAIREFHEELGAEGHEIELVGRLSTLYVHASNFAVQPWVGSTRQRPNMTPDPREVEALLEVPLWHMLDPASIGWTTRRYRGQPYTAPHILWQSHCIWGATCMILGELAVLLEEMGVQDL